MTRETKKLQNNLKLLKLDLKRDPDNPTIYYSMADTLTKLAKNANNDERDIYVEQALAYFDKAIELSNYEHPLYLVARAQLYEELGNDELAIENVVAAARLPQEDGSIGRHIADISKSIGKKLIDKIPQFVEQNKITPELANQFSVLIEKDHLATTGITGDNKAENELLAWVVKKVKELEEGAQLSNGQVVELTKQMIQVKDKFSLMEEKMELLNAITQKMQHQLAENTRNYTNEEREQVSRVTLELKQTLREIITKVSANDQTICDLTSEMTYLLTQDELTTDRFLGLNEQITRLQADLAAQQQQLAEQKEEVGDISSRTQGIEQQQQQQGQQLATLEEQIAAYRAQADAIITELTNKHIELIEQIQAITEQLDQAAMTNQQELVEQLAKQQEKLQTELVSQNISMMDRLISLEVAVNTTASSEQFEIGSRFEALKQNEPLYKYCSTICMELISYFKTYQILYTGLVEGGNLNDLSDDHSNFSNIRSLISGVGNVGFKIVTGIVDHYTMDLLSAASKIGEQGEKGKIDNQVTKINLVINSKLLTPAKELDIGKIQQLALQLVAVREDKILAFATEPTEQAAGGTAWLRAVDNMLGSIKDKLMPILARYTSKEEQLAANDALMVLGYICDNYNSIEQSNKALAGFFDDWSFKELEVCSQMQEPLAKVMKAARENKWDEGGKIKIRKNIAGRLEEEYLREKLGSLYNEENVEITKMLYFAMINKGIIRGNHQNQECIEIFKGLYPDLTDKIAEEHPEYFMGNMEAMQICGCSAIPTRDSNPIISGKGLEQHEQSDLDYWYEYSKPAMDELLKLRIEAAGITETDATIVQAVGPWYGYDASSIEVINKLVHDITQAVNSNPAGEGNKQATVLTALNLSNKHWVGVIVEKLKGEHLLISYIDPEQQEIAAPLKETLLTGFRLANSGANVEFSQLMTETQSYDNCGPEVIENMLQYLCGHRVSQEDSVYIHSILLEQALLGADGCGEVGV